MNKESKQQEFSNDQIARRKLLTLAAYVPPAILGVMIAGNKVAEAGATLGQTKKCGGGQIIVSAGGNACCPCIPGDPKYNAVKCNETKCKLGNCAACKQLIFQSEGKCTAKMAVAGCACTCAPVNAPGGGLIPGGAGGGGGGAWWQASGC